MGRERRSGELDSVKVIQLLLVGLCHRTPLHFMPPDLYWGGHSIFSILLTKIYSLRPMIPSSSLPLIYYFLSCAIQYSLSCLIIFDRVTILFNLMLQKNCICIYILCQILLLNKQRKVSYLVVLRSAIRCDTQIRTRICARKRKRHRPAYTP